MAIVHAWGGSTHGFCSVMAYMKEHFELFTRGGAEYAPPPRKMRGMAVSSKAPWKVITPVSGSRAPG